jgi:uncharacterized protein (TIGR02117 family)
MLKMRKLLACLLCASWLSACAAVPSSRLTDAQSPDQAVRVVSNGWHTAIVIPRVELAASGLLPEAEDFPDAAFLEFGWGDRVYFPAERVTLGITLEAALIPTPAIMHIAGLSRAPELAHPDAEVLTVMLTETGLGLLIGSIAADFERPEEGRAMPVAPGLYPNSHFYPAHGAFHLFNTCNTWTARKLSEGGVELSSSGVVTADDLMARLREAIGTEQ